MRVGHATPALLEDLQVNVYETSLSLKEVAAISAPDPNHILIAPWDGNIIENIIKAIHGSDLDLNPAVIGNTVYVPIPQLFEERRKEMLRTLGKLAEDAKIAVRNIRQDKIKSADNLKDKGKISEDEHTRFRSEVQELVDKYNQQIDTFHKAKEQEILG